MARNFLRNTGSALKRDARTELVSENLQLQDKLAFAKRQYHELQQKYGLKPSGGLTLVQALIFIAVTTSLIVLGVLFGKAATLLAATFFISLWAIHHFRTSLKIKLASQLTAVVSFHSLALVVLLNR